MTSIRSVRLAASSGMRKLETNRQMVWLTSLVLIPAVLSANRAFCADEPVSNDLLLNLFIEKGYVSQAEAEKVKQEAAKRQAQMDQYKADAEKYKTELDQIKSDMADLKAKAEFYQTNMPGSMPESKWVIGKGVKSVELFGDIRVRYEERVAKDPGGRKIVSDRARYSARFGLRGDLFDDVYYGFRMETSSNPRSAWITMGGSGQTSPFGKANGGIYIGQAYFGWKRDWVDITLGKMPNPLYTTQMVWDPDLSPEGAAETFKYSVGDAGFFATFGQFIYQDTNPNQYASGYFNPIDTYSSSLPLLLALQGGVNYEFTKKVNFKVAPVLYLYTQFNDGRLPPNSGDQYSPDFQGTYVGQGQKFGPAGPAYYNLDNPGFDGYYANQNGVNKLMVLDIPMELNIELSKVHLRFFGDYAQNLQGKDRAQDAYKAANSFYFSLNGPGAGNIQPISSPQTHDIHAYQVGFGIGSTNLVYGPTKGLVFGNSSKKNAWEFRTYWQHIEQYSLDPNLIDSDFFDGRENLEGIYAALAYGLFDNVIATVRYGYAERINDKLGTGGVGGDIPQMNPVNKYSLLQVDVGVRF